MQPSIEIQNDILAVAPDRWSAIRERRDKRLEQALVELEKLRETKKTAEEKRETRTSTSDPEARVMKQVGGGFAPSYNAQISTDGKHGLIVAVDVTQAGNVVDGAEAKLSPDGNWIAYNGPGSGILVERFPGHGGRIQVSAGAAAQPRWSHDGKQIFFIQPDRKLIAVSFDPDTGTAGPPRVLFQTRIAAERVAQWQYTVAPDGRFLIDSLPANTASPLTLITGWDVPLRQR